MQFLLDLDVAGDLREAGHGRQAVGDAHLVVGADAVVAGALDVAGHQVLAVVRQAAVGEEQIADVVDGQQVVGLGIAVGVALEDGVDVRRGVAGERIDRPRRD